MFNVYRKDIDSDFFFYNERTSACNINYLKDEFNIRNFNGNNCWILDFNARSL